MLKEHFLAKYVVNAQEDDSSSEISSWVVQKTFFHSSGCSVIKRQATYTIFITSGKEKYKHIFLRGDALDINTLSILLTQ